MARRQSDSQAASPAAILTAGDMRDAWSCTLPNEIFEVGCQGPEEDAAGLGVAIALGKLISEWYEPVRRAAYKPAGSPCSLFSTSTDCLLCLLAGLGPEPVQRDGRATHRAERAHAFVPVRRAPRPGAASTESDAHIRHGAGLPLAHVRRRGRHGLCFGGRARASLFLTRSRIK